MSVPAEAPQLQGRSCTQCHKQFNVPATSTATQCADCQIGAAQLSGGPVNYTNQADLQNRGRGKGQLFGGLALMIVGIAITAGTYSHAQAEGGSYYISVGPIVAGLVMFIRGLINMG
ncbi:MAG TPA: hypothetical protein VGM39_06690 [Kofleriaceae bacterium]|jgi:hypothetical protein